MPAEIIKIALADEHTLFRKLLKNYLSEQENINVIIQAADVFDLLDKLKDFSVDILLLDIFMTKWNVSDALKVIRNQYPEIKVLILSTCTDLEIINDLLDAGIYGYISKEDEPEELLRAITMVASNRIYRNGLFTEALYWNKQNNIVIGRHEPVVVLNEREKKILQLLWEEKSNKEIANQLFLSIRSIEKIRQDMKEKLGVGSTVGLLKYGIARKVIEMHNGVSV